ncbi:MAG: glycosyltransferase family 2 protein, partial [Actinomycetota bacterium]|nr:glycosyltransferase family 2 protein [Actinomycetota bacterium]
MTNPPLVSVVIPAYNHARYIASTLDSVVREGYPNLEILVLDDGSTDQTFAAATAWAERNQRIPIQVTQQENAGLTKTLNRLLEAANGDFVAYLASDDR